MKAIDHENDHRILLYILTGNEHKLPDTLRRKRQRVKRRKPAFITAVRPETMQSPTKKRRTNPRNPYMNERKAWKKETSYESRSQDIEDYARRAVYFRIMSNRAKEPSRFNERPCHRKMQPTDNVGPEPIHN